MGRVSSLRLRPPAAAPQVGLPEEGGAEHCNDAQIQDHAGSQCPHRAQEGGHRGLAHKPRPPRHHVRQHPLHLEVGAHHRTHVEQLVAVAWGGDEKGVTWVGWTSEALDTMCQATNTQANQVALKIPKQ